LFSTARLPSAISPLSLHDALPISCGPAISRHLFNSVRDVDSHLAEQIRDQTEHAAEKVRSGADEAGCGLPHPAEVEREEFSGSLDRKSTRLNSSHVSISYAVFCLK